MYYVGGSSGTKKIKHNKKLYDYSKQPEYYYEHLNDDYNI